jgi:CRP-like cAMP-binding protein
MFENVDIKIEQLQAEREHQKAVIKAAEAEIARLDKVLAAYQVLIDEHILPASDRLLRVVIQQPDSQGEAQENGGRAAKRDAEVDEALKRIGAKAFTVSDVANLTGLDRRRVKRSLDDRVQSHTIRLTRKGNRGRAARYKTMGSDEMPGE